MVYVPYEGWTYGGLGSAGGHLIKGFLTHPLGWTLRFLLAGHHTGRDLFPIEKNDQMTRASDVASGRFSTGWYWIEQNGEILYYHSELKPEPVMIPPIANPPSLVGSGEHTLLMSGYERPSKNQESSHKSPTSDSGTLATKGPTGLRGHPEQRCPRGYRFNPNLNACIKH